ncbi:MAG: RNA polymerase sigma factor [Actinomycetota bacterium]|nr:RNA polymerase sigma factor [Actinomycetota bacterium]
MASHEPFQAFLDAHGAVVLGFLRAMVGRIDADDCFQETFMSALRSYESLDGANPRAWVLRIARNKAIDHHRGRARRPVPRGDLPEVPAPSESQPNPDVWEAVAALPDKQRAAVALRFASDLRFREVGMAMGISEEAARRNVHEGLRKLRETVIKESR